MKVRGPLAGSYAAAVVMVVCALIPYLGLTAALGSLTPVLAKDLHLSHQALALTSGMANAAYAFGTVLAVQFAQHLPGRRMLILYATLFVIASVLAATALTPGLFIAGHVVQGLTTSLMLIGAVPPLVIGWPVSRMRVTAIVMNLCIFGAVAIGPVVGGVQAGAHEWQPLFWIVTGFGGAALLFILLTFEDQPPQDTSAPWDLVSLALAGVGCGASFFGASELTTHRLLDLVVFLPLLGGIALLLALVAHQATVRRPLMPVRQIATTLPIAGIIIAMTAGAAAIAVIDLVETALQPTMSPVHLGTLFWPEFGGAIASAALFGLIFRTRFIPVLAFGGMAAIAGGAVVLTGAVTGGPQALVVVGSGLLGVGVGASVSPALFIAGFSLHSAQIQRIFALIELLRGVAAFMVGPVLLHLAMTTGGSPAKGAQIAIWVCVAIAAGGGLLAFYVLVLGRSGLQTPDLERWQGDGEPAWESPPFAAGIRRRGRRERVGTGELSPS